jgi:hypothetical protein
MTDILKNINEFLPSLKAGQTYTLPSGYKPAVYAAVDNLWLRKTPASAQPEFAVPKNTYIGEVRSVAKVDASDTPYRVKVHYRKQTPAGTIGIGEYWVNLGKADTVTGKLLLPYIQIVSVQNVTKDDAEKLIKSIVDTDSQILDMINQLPTHIINKDSYIEEVIKKVMYRQELIKSSPLIKTYTKTKDFEIALYNKMKVASNFSGIFQAVFNLYGWVRQKISGVPVLVADALVIVGIAAAGYLLFTTFRPHKLDAEKDFTNTQEYIKKLVAEGKLSQEEAVKIQENLQKDVDTYNENNSTKNALEKMLTTGAVIVGGVLLLKLLKK